MTFLAAGVNPPIRLFADSTRIPPPLFGRARVPAGFVPMRLPSITLPPLPVITKMPPPPNLLIDQPANDRVAAEDPEPVRSQAVAVQLDDRRRSEARLRGAVDDHGRVMHGMAESGTIVAHAAPGMLKTIVSRSSLSAFDSAIA